MKIIQFEWKKLWKSKLFLGLLLVTAVFISGLFLRNYIYQDSVKTERVEYFQEQSSQVLRQYITDQQDLAEIGEDSSPNLVEAVEIGASLYRKLGELLTAIQTDEHLSSLQLENEAYELAMQYQSIDKHYPLSVGEMEREMKLNEALLEKELPKEHLTASIQPAVFIKHVVHVLLNTFGFFILLMVVGTPIVREFDDQTIKLSYGLPISSTRMVLSKWMTMALAGLIWFIFVLGFSYAISSLFGKSELHAFDYPFYTEQMTFIDGSAYLQQSILFGVLYLFALMSLFIFISFLLKHTVIVHLVLLILFAGNYLFITNGYIHPSLPWGYQELDHAILQTASVSWLGAIVSVLFTGIILLLAIQASKRREHRT
jgi:ABC-2 type transport system permease protein